MPASALRDTPDLAAAVLAAASGSHLETTLHEIVEAAVRHVGAGFGALGVLTPDGRRLDRFVLAGVDPGGAPTSAPNGERGFPGALGTEPAVLRLEELARHPAVRGVPPGLPPMRSFLGLPVRVGNVVFGNLYLAEKRDGGEFMQADVQIGRALAGVAGLAIENARLAERAERRRRWGQAATEMATALLSGADPDEVLRSVTTRVAALTGADMAGVLSPSLDDDETLTIVAAVGPAAGEVEGVRVPLHENYVDETHRSGVPRLIDDISRMPLTGQRAESLVELTAGAGPAMLVPLCSTPDRGLLVTMRAAGREPFEQEDLDLLSAFAAHASVVLELAHAQQRERRLQMLADRDRIARDLHDHVVQRIFATALALDRISRSLERDFPGSAARIAARVDELHGTIERIRTSIFELHEVDDASSVAVRQRLAEVIRSATEGHGLTPTLRVRSDETDLPPDLVAELVAVVRELVTNVVRHAQARRVTVDVDVDEDVRIAVTDDGHGLPAVAVRSGLANLADRADRRGGQLTTLSSPSGTEVRWTVPRPPRR